MLDIVSYILGKKGQSSTDVAVYGDIQCEDDGEGNITITLVNSNAQEGSNNG